MHVNIIFTELGMEKKKTLLVDDHQLVLDGISNLLTSLEAVEVVGVANNGKRALEIIENIQIDLVLMDIDMPVMNGLEATAQIKKSFPHIKIIILSMHDEHAVIQKVMNLGADGYLLKNSDKDEFWAAIEKVLEGQKFFSADVTMALLNKKESSSSSDSVTLAQLTEREVEILRNIAEGLSNKEIGEKLFISHRTVDTHRTNLMRKLEAKNIAGLVRFAIKNGLVE